MMRDLARVALSLKPLFSAPSEELELKFLGIVGQQSLPTLDIETTQRAEDRDLCSPSRRPSQGRGKGRDGAAGSVEKIEAHVVLRNEANERRRRLATGSRASRSVRPLLRPSAGRSCQKSCPSLRALAEELKVIRARTSFMLCSRDRDAVAAGCRTPR